MPWWRQHRGWSCLMLLPAVLGPAARAGIPARWVQGEMAIKTSCLAVAERGERGVSVGLLRNAGYRLIFSTCEWNGFGEQEECMFIVQPSICGRQGVESGVKSQEPMLACRGICCLLKRCNVCIFTSSLLVFLCLKASALFLAEIKIIFVCYLKQQIQTQQIFCPNLSLFSHVSSSALSMGWSWTVIKLWWNGQNLHHVLKVFRKVKIVMRCEEGCYALCYLPPKFGSEMARSICHSP